MTCSIIANLLNPQLKEIKKRLKDEFHPIKILLYGSQARGTTHTDVQVVELSLAAKIILAKLKNLKINLNEVAILCWINEDDNPGNLALKADPLKAVSFQIQVV